MKAIILFALFTVAAAKVVFYTADDSPEVEALIAKIEEDKKFVDCYLDKGPCSKRAAIYKELIPDALATKCSKCTDALKHLAHGFFLKVKTFLPEDYIQLRLKYDPENKYFDDFIKAIEPY